jgi:hypothetical protein
MIDAEGNFTAEFTEALPGMLGEDHKDFKGFDDTPNIQTLVKRWADDKSFVGKKLENVIQKPAQDATDEQKDEYTKALRAELGIPDAAENYVYPELAEGEDYREGSKEYWSDIFKKLNISQEQATGLTNALHEMQRHNIEADNKAATEAGEKQLGEQVKAIDDMYPGEEKPAALRHALAFIDKYGTEALQGAVKEANLFDNHDLKTWAPLVNLDSLPLLVNAGKAMANNTMPPGEPSKGATGPQVAAIAALNKMTVEAVQQVIAQYPNSWNDGSMLRLPK